MSVPAGFTHHPIATHGGKPRDDVFKRPGQNMVHARRGIGSRRTFIKNKIPRRPLSVDGLFECMVVLPELLNFLLSGYKLVRHISVTCGFSIKKKTAAVNCVKSFG